MDHACLNLHVENHGQLNIDVEPATPEVESGLTDEQWSELARMVSEIHGFLLGNTPRHPIQ